ncbi:LOW QUALITY PROTEIN: phospholipid-transporting ATPase ABCA3 [Drosophila gunungcola]|uniref:LOW QUALITY PROTEIN: phospholipid-transporting ATPase ABCA3 n=1 Tax=Drosophila gunungcola TaxID=103775 RepID=UPI0022E27A00|nr:LOW QUALITY PROTEIN: phospholipid-transporting ATPase ABCA3 [Drosophila gunungcola]
MKPERESFSNTEVYSVGDWQKFKLLLWKNWTLQWNQKMQIFCVMLLPTLFLCLIVIMRLIIRPEAKPEIRYHPESTSDLLLYMKTIPLGNRITHENGTLNIPRNFLCFTPDTPFNTEIMNATVLRLRLLGIRPYDTASHMEKDMLMHNFLAGVEFGEQAVAINDNGYPIELNYTIRFPSELRTMEGPVIETWTTSRLYLPYDSTGPRNREINDGGVPVGYIREGFLPIQHALTMSWLTLASGITDADLPHINIQRFPYRAFSYDQLLSGLRQLLPFVILLSFIYPCSTVTKYVTTEKELQLKEIMKLIGVHNWLHWMAWFVKSYVMLMVVVLLIMFLMMIKFYFSVSVLSHANVLPVLVFLHTYVIASICFCFLLAVMFSKASTASAVACILWFITFIPYSFAYYYYDRLNLFHKLLISMVFTNSALGFGLHVIIMWEGTGEGVTWHNMFQPISEDDDLTLFYVIMAMTFGAGVYFIICLYVEQVFPGDYGIPRRWDFIFRRSFWLDLMPFRFVIKNAKFESTASESPNKKKSCRTNRVVGVQLCDLQKTYGKHRAVKGINLKMYRNDITVLLGHNGAGKTTTINMITGIIKPTSGTAIVNGYDIRHDLAKARQSLGICPQVNILFNNMSVRDHIKFFSKLKGIRGSKAVDNEVGKYVTMLELQDKSFVAAEKLSGGMKRKLALCCALCGNARVVLCDEPSSGIDAAGRRSLWDLLQSEKNGRTILLTTHYMDEADVLGDRIAVIANGLLQCQGTSFYLKKKFGTGYQLVCMMKSGCNVAAVTELINRHVPNLKLERQLGTELTYRLSTDYSKNFAALLKDLDVNCDNLKLEGYGLSGATLEDVFIEVNSERRVRGGEDVPQAEKSVGFKDLVFDTRTRETRAWIRFCMFWQALFLKKFYITIGYYWLMIIQICLPIIIMTLTIFNSRGGRIYYELPSMPVSILQYKYVYVVLDDNATDPASSLAVTYMDHLKQFGNRVKLLKTGDSSFEDYILSRDISEHRRVDFDYVAGLTISKDNLTAWLNNKPLHTAPLTLNLLHNALAIKLLGKEASTYVSNFPLPYSEDTRTLRLNKGQRLGAEIAINLSLTMAFVTSFFAIPVIKERETRAKLLQFLSGVDVCAYWTSQMVWDYFIFIISVFSSIFTIAAFQERGYSTPLELSRFFYLLLIFGLAAIPLSYALSGFFSNAATGFTRISIFNTLAGSGFFMLVVALDFEAFQLQHVASALAWYFRLFPHYSLASAAHHIHIGYNIRSGCSLRSITKLSEKERCRNVPICCNIPGYFAWKSPGTLPDIVYLLAVGLALFLLPIMYDAKVFDAIGEALSKLCSGRKRSRGGSSIENEDVVAERLVVREMINAQRKDIPLLVDNITKRYKDKLAVRGISFHVAHAECFGLLGVNGAGKTSTFKMLTGDHKITSGEAYLDGDNISTHKIHGKIGYCPQFDALFDDLTGRQTLKMYCLLKGVQRRHINAITWTLAVSFGFEKHLDKRTKHYSGGNKRKLSTAIAVLGNPSVLYLDEPTSGMDPGARRQLWQVIGLIRTAGKSIVLTSHSMDECEALCTRLAIMVDGEFKCIGSVQSLKIKYSKGLILKIKIKHKKKNFQRILERSSSSSQNNSFAEADPKKHSFLGTDNLLPDRVLRVNRFILEEIPHSEFKDEYNGLVTYYMPQSTNLATIFQLLESNMQKLNIEDYLIMQTRLEEIFLDFASKRAGSCSDN